MNKNITVISGDGIGPEVTRETIKVLNAVALKFQHNFNFTHCLMGAVAIDKTGDPLPQDTIESCLKSDAVLLGAIGHPKYDNDPTAKVRPEQGLLRIRKELQLFANIRPVSTYQSLHHLSPLKEKQLQGVDFIIYRELTGGIYFGKKETNEEGNEASDLCIYNKIEIERIAHLAFDAAQKRRKKLTLVDKANVLETSRLWRKTVQEIAMNYAEVIVDYMFVDNAAMQIIVNPKQFDVMLTENMFGDILSDEASVISGSLGLLPSSSIGKVNALFEPIHGSYPQAAGKDIANPVGSILSAAMMMDHFELFEESKAIRNAVEWTLGNGFVTKDIDPVNYYFTSTIGELISDYLCNDLPQHINVKNVALGQTTII
ncbi:MAG: 3-isopropylmalate dehydrogenase [Bacteroidota bacterium]|nr:3-isopropylmalate dehydrogenase [Bacteroidota bacterium]